MDWHRYRFHSVWRLDAAPREVYAALERAEDYPRWWPQVRGVGPAPAPAPGGPDTSADPDRADPAPDPAAEAGASDPRRGADGVIRFRSVLPYELVVTAREARRDPAAGVLEISMAGDLEGWARWTVCADGAAGSRAVFDQDVVVRKPLMRRLALPGRPLFRLNHALMMRAGRRGLRSSLAAHGPLRNGLWPKSPAMYRSRRPGD
ncbi:polyketide cyclase [Streptantibioticus silvisoli]|uniref:Polyketide cyclase n=1 Tax=Streptantibioticus silvisoli TaxID=2705255 RepID=A0ABT6W1Q9_9ACTN|nr:polyketide cyclase [Streptantibioticus silvisoli]MDI5964655.1 polyketide cyclase [Streptantibioticus silvisoli]